MFRPAIAAIAFLLLALPLQAEQKDGRARRKPAPFVQQALRWLPVDVETVVVSQGSIEIPFDRAEAPGGGPGSAFHALPVGLISELRQGILRDQLKGHKLTFAVEGSRRFRSPKSLGMMPFDGCQILRFNEASDDAVKTAFRFCLDHADAKEQIGGIQVAVLKEKWEQDDWTLLVAQPQPQILLCATDRAFLEEVLKRMGGQGEGRALPDSLSEWEHVNVNAPVWAVRHYCKETAGDDPSSPLGPDAAANRPDPQAIGFVFWYAPETANPLTARYLSKAPAAKQIIADCWLQPNEHLTPKITIVAPGVVEITAKTGKEDSWGSFLFVLLAYLGHGVYV